MSKLLRGKVALVTGAGRGIGHEIALRLARDGAKVVVHYSRRKAGADETVAMIEAMGEAALAYPANISKRADVVALFKAINRDPEQLDIVVNDSGVSAQSKLADLSDFDVEAVLGVNMLGQLYIASQAANRLHAGGRIINCSSSLAKYPMAGAGLYSAAKSAVQSLTESWAREPGERGITVNTVIPGATSPGMMDNSSAYRAFFENASPFKRIGQAAELPRWWRFPPRRTSAGFPAYT